MNTATRNEIVRLASVAGISQRLIDEIANGATAQRTTQILGGSVEDAKLNCGALVLSDLAACREARDLAYDSWMAEIAR